MKIISIGEGGNEENTIPEGMCLTSTGFDAEGLRLEDGNVVVNLTTRILQAGEADYIKENGELPQGEEFNLGEAHVRAGAADHYVCASRTSCSR